MSFTGHSVDFTIDYLDIVSANKLLIPNQESCDHPERFIRENYKFNIIIQIELSAVNGVSAISLTHNEEGNHEAAIITDEKEIVKRSNISVASIFLQCMHEDLSEYKHLLVNKQQELVADLLLEKI
jgi:hypothetical protein